VVIRKRWCEILVECSSKSRKVADLKDESSCTCLKIYLFKVCIFPSSIVILRNPSEHPLIYLP
jgi:hypothetical protein